MYRLGFIIEKEISDRNIRAFCEVEYGGVHEFHKTSKDLSFSVAIKTNASFTGGIKETIEGNSHYSTFRICKMYVENTSESDYQLWPVDKDPNIS